LVAGLPNYVGYANLSAPLRQNLVKKVYKKSRHLLRDRPKAADDRRYASQLQGGHQTAVLRLLIEAGAQVNAYAVEMGLLDKVWLFYAPKFLGAEAVPLLAGGGPLPPLRDYRLHRFGSDFAVEGYLRDVYRNH